MTGLLVAPSTDASIQPQEPGPSTNTVHPHHRDPAAEDEMDDVGREALRLILTRGARRVEVTVELRWGRYLQKLLGEVEPIVVPFGTAAAHDVLKGYFDGPSEAWDAVWVPKLEANPTLLLEVLEYACGIESLELLRRGCVIFSRLFCAIPMRWPADDPKQIFEFGDAVRKTFQLPGQDEMTRERCDEILKYLRMQTAPHQLLRASNAAGDLTHSVDPSLLLWEASRAVNDVDFTKAAESLDPFRQKTWQPDDAVDQCPCCRRTFRSSMYNALMGVHPSHCRVCGKKICFDCTQFRVDKSIARLSKPGGPEEPQLRKACVDCYRTAKEVQDNCFLSQVFVLSGLNTIQLSMLRTVNRKWCRVAELCLHELRSTLYEYIGMDQSVLQARNQCVYTHTNEAVCQLPPPSSISHTVQRLCRNNIALLEGHPEQVLLLFFCVDWAIDAEVEKAVGVLRVTARSLSSSGRRNVSDTAACMSSPNYNYHWHLLCSRTCGTMHRGFFGVRMLEALTRAPPEHPLLRESLSIVMDLLRKGTHPAPVRSALVPLLLDAFRYPNTAAAAWTCLMELVCKYPVLGLQAIFDEMSRSGSDSVASESLRDQVEVMVVNPPATGSSPPLGPQDANTVQEAKASVSGETHRFSMARRFLQTLDQTMQQLKASGKASDEAVVRSQVLKALKNGGFTLLSKQALPPFFSLGGGGPASPTQAAPSLASQSTSSWISIQPMMFFFDSKITIDAINIDGITVKSSAIRPVYIPLLDSSGREHAVLWKGEQLRQDYIVSICGQMTRGILVDAQEIPNDDAIPTYKVLPLSINSGLIQCVRNSVSIHDIVLPSTQSPGGGSVSSGGPQQEQQSPLLLHLKQLERNRSDQIAHNFLASARFFILFNYLLLLKDRHRDNVMLTEMGSVFHIDFGMILNQRTMAEAVGRMSYVRFDGDLEQCIITYWNSAKTGVGKAQAHATDDAAARKKLLEKFLFSVASWFALVRPFSSDYFLLLRHVMLHRGKPSKGASSSATFQPTHTGFANRSLAQTPSDSLGGASGSVSNFLAEQRHLFSAANEKEPSAKRDDDVQELKVMLTNVFMRDMAEKTCCEHFVHRVNSSRGQEWFKDLTYTTRKKTRSMLQELSDRVVAWAMGGSESPSSSVLKSASEK